MPERHTKAPRSKEELINKLLSYDFSGDIRDLGEGTQISRVAPNIVRLMFPETGRVFDLTVHIPREAQGFKEDWSVTTRRPGKKQ